MLQADTAAVPFPAPCHPTGMCCFPREFPPAPAAAQGGSAQQELGWAGSSGSSWQGREHSPGHPCPQGIFLGVSLPWHCLCSLGVLGAAHTCTPTCARLSPGTTSCSCLLLPFPAAQDAAGSSACGAPPSLAAATNHSCCSQTLISEVFALSAVN